MMRANGIQVSVQVDLPPLDAFRAFTDEIGAWWKPGLKYRFRSNGRMRFDGGARLIEENPDGEPYEVGRVRVWEPGKRLLFDWRLPNFADGEVTEVEVRFEPEGNGTRVVLEHRGFQALRKDHPARHGLADDVAYGRMLASWWDGLLAELQAYKSKPGEMKMDKHIRPGHTPVTPYLTVSSVPKLLEFLKQAFGAEVLNQTQLPDGVINHAEVRVNGQVLMCGQAREEWKAMPGSFSVYVPDCNAVFERAVAAGATVLYPPADHEYGDRSGGVQDPVGNYWWITTHLG